MVYGWRALVVKAKIAEAAKILSAGRWAGLMARKLKTYQTSLGFYDLAVTAPSMKAALEAWGAGSNLFHQGVAKESSDPEVVADTMSKPGIVLRRPVGSNGRFREQAELPTDLAGKEPNHKPKKTFAIRPRKQWPVNSPMWKQLYSEQRKMPNELPAKLNGQKRTHKLRGNQRLRQSVSWPMRKRLERPPKKPVIAAIRRRRVLVRGCGGGWDGPLQILERVRFV
jgi:hypothetical protein